MHKTLLVLMFLCPCFINAADLSSFEKILLPMDVTARAAGVGGSSFAVYFSVYAEVPYNYFPCTTLIRPDGIRVCEAAAGQTFLQIPTEASGSGRIIFVDRATAPQIGIAYTLSSALPVECTPFVACGTLTSLPVVRESSFRTGKIILPEIAATSSRYRHTLRIYDVDSRGNQAFRVSILMTPTARNTPDVVKTFVPTSTIAPLLSDPMYAQTYPPYAQISLEQEFNELCFPRIVCGAAYCVRVEVQAVDPTTRFWAFVSATNNLSQEVTIFEPK
jgi:hypothetical protein